MIFFGTHNCFMKRISYGINYFMVRLLFNFILINILYVVYYGSSMYYPKTLILCVYTFETILIMYTISFGVSHIKSDINCNQTFPYWFDILNLIVNIYDMSFGLFCVYLFAKPVLNISKYSEINEDLLYVCVKYFLIVIITEIIAITSQLIYIISKTNIDIIVLSSMIDAIGVVLLFKEWNILYKHIFCCHPFLTQKLTKYIKNNNKP